MKKRCVRSIQGGLYAALVLLAGAISAVLSHVAIDIAGDVVLAHDTYDGIAHHSRALFGGVVVALAAAAMLRFLWEALDRRCSSLTAVLRRLRAARGASPWRFVALVVAAAFVALIAMERIDAAFDGVRAIGIADLLGGSVALGTSVTAGVALAVGWTFRLAMHALADWEPAIAAFFARLLPRTMAARASSVRPRTVLTATLDGACRLARRSGKRAPPLTSPA